MTKKLAYSYIRMSTELQLKGDSLRRQAELSKQYADENNLELVEDYKLTDIGYSAFKGDNISRGALGKFLDAIKANEIPKGSFLLVESLDRLSRQKINISVSLLFEITNAGINIVTLSDRQVYKAGEAEFTQLISSIVIMARANEESEIKSSRLSAVWKNKRSQVHSRKLTSQCPAWLKLSADKTKFVKLDYRVAIVQSIFDAAVQGAGSYSITRELNNSETPTFGKSSRWIESYVTKILCNRAVLGEFQPHRKIGGKRIPEGRVIPNYYPAIIEEKLFLAVQVARKMRKSTGSGRKGRYHRNLFTHLAKCDYCGSSMHFVNKGSGPKGGTYLKCSKNIYGDGCIANSWNYIKFETSFLNFVREINLNEIVALKNSRFQQANLNQQILIDQEKLEDLQQKRKQILNLLLVKDQSSDFLREQLNIFSEEITNLEKSIHSKTEIKESLSTPEISSDISNEIHEIQNFDSKSNYEKRQRISSRLKEIILEISVATDGKKPRLPKALALVENSQNPNEDNEQLIKALKDSYQNSIDSNPYFTVRFLNGNQRLIIPDPNNPSNFLSKVELDDVLQR